MDCGVFEVGVLRGGRARMAKDMVAEITMVVIKSNNIIMSPEIYWDIYYKFQEGIKVNPDDYEKK